MIKSFIKNVALSFGYAISKYDSKRDPSAVLNSYFNKFNINLVFDVGANSGQFAQMLRKNKYRGKIISFEPLSTAYKGLELLAEKDLNWQVQQCALGDKVEEAEINIAGNSWSSSLLNMLPEHIKQAPDSIYIDKEKIQVEILDNLMERYATQDDQIVLKIDTQGYTKKVLDGGGQSLKRIKGILVELSLVPLYENEPLIGEVITTLYDKGFTLVFIEPEFIEKEIGQQLQVNGLFFRL